MPNSLLATACPLNPSPGAFPAYVFTVAGVAAAPTAPVTEPLPYGTGGAGLVGQQLPGITARNGARADLASRMGAGVWALGDGLAVAAGTGLLVSVAPGHALIDGPIELAAAQSLAVPDNTARVWLWLVRGAAGGPPTLFANAALTLPASPCVLLGSCTTASGAVTGVDTSGVLRLVGGRAQRHTADAGAPADTPAADITFDALTAGGQFEWNGAAYTGGARRQTLIGGSAHSVTLTPDVNYLLGWDFSAAPGGVFSDALYASLLTCTDQNLLVNAALSQRTTGKVFFNLHYPSIAGSTAAVTLIVIPACKGEGYTGASTASLAGTWDSLVTIG